jgi:hypothetical protein
MSWTHRLWVGLATLWFFWPFVLAIHPARSVRRVLVPLIIAAPFVLLWFRLYSSVLAPPVFGLPPGLSLSPPDLVIYAVAYQSGSADAKKDMRGGRLNLEAFGFGTITPGAPNFSEATLKQYGIEVTHVAGCVVDSRIEGHAYGYNVAMVAEIKRRCGVAVVTEAEREDARWIQSYDDGKEAGRAEALSELQAGRLALEISDPPKKGDTEFEKMLGDRYQINLRRVDPHADPKMSNKVFGHVAGVNEVAEAEITRRFGQGTVESIWKSFYTTPSND